jgi:hypothetical protein
MDVPGQNHPLQPGYCANCQAPLSGRYCSACGQRADSATHTLSHFIGEAAEVVTHADSRLWRTVWPLLARPGFLTREYFAGRRARYLQPFRLYLIMSVLFFVLTAVLSGGTRSADRPAERIDPKDCSDVTTNLHVGSYQLLPRLQAACRNIRADSGREFSDRLVHNLGRALFVFLPVMAALMKLLYWRPRRYYLEHLLLLIHNHSFAFVVMSIYALATVWITSGNVVGVLFLLAAWWLVRYLYRSMKTVYGQSALLTFVKFCVLGFAYLLCGLSCWSRPRFTASRRCSALVPRVAVAYSLCDDSSRLVSVFAMPSTLRIRPSTRSKASSVSARSSAMMSQRPFVVCSVRTAGSPRRLRSTASALFPSTAIVISAVMSRSSIGVPSRTV